MSQPDGVGAFQGPITADEGTISVAVANYASVAIQLAGTFTATVQFEATVDNANWVSIAMTPSGGGSTVTSATAGGAWRGDCGGYYAVRARASSFSAGPIEVSIAAAVLTNAAYNPFDQSLNTTDSPTFGGVMVTNGGAYAVGSFTNNALNPSLKYQPELLLTGNIASSVAAVGPNIYQVVADSDDSVGAFYDVFASAGTRASPAIKSADTYIFAGDQYAWNGTYYQYGSQWISYTASDTPNMDGSIPSYWSWLWTDQAVLDQGILLYTIANKSAVIFNNGHGMQDSADGVNIVGAFNGTLGVLRAGGYKSSDGSAGATVTTCTAFKNGLCVSGT